jgi:hypothetical protein
MSTEGHQHILIESRHMDTQPENNSADDIALMQVVAILARQGINTTVQARDGVLVAEFVDGFYKSDGMAYLRPQSGRLFLHARYSERTEIKGLDDVVRCSKQWHEFSHERFDGWKVPPSHWAALYTSVLGMADTTEG